MRCKDCGNISRFEIYRLVIKKIVLDFHSAVTDRARSAIEYDRDTETGPPLAIRCIKCGAEGSPEDFTYTEKDAFFTDPEGREGFHVPDGIPPLDKIKVEVKFKR